MPHNLDLILTLSGSISAALLLGFLTHLLGLSPIVGYLLAGVVVGPFTPGFVADLGLAEQLAEIGVILLMFGVGLSFHVKELLAVRRIAVPGAIVQSLVATLLGALVARSVGWDWTAGVVFGLSISVASTVVLTRVLSDNRALHTQTGHIAVGWLVVEDLFTVIVLVILPSLRSDEGSLWWTLLVALLKLGLLGFFTLTVGQRLIPALLGYVSKTRSRELFTLTVLALALGIAVGSAKLFGASMALGAFLAGMVVGQSDFSARAAAEAMPMRDAFAVLFFVSVGMLFDPARLMDHWWLSAATLAVVLLGKPLAAFVVVRALRYPPQTALSVSVALAQIGEFSFIVAALGGQLGLLPPEASQALVITAIISITLNPILYRAVAPLARRLYGELPTEPKQDAPKEPHTIVIGYGPVGRTLVRLLQENGLTAVVIELNHETIQQLRAEGIRAVYGDASQRETLEHAGIQRAHGLVFTAAGDAAGSIIRQAKELNPNVAIFARTTYLKEIPRLKELGAQTVVSGEGEVALAMIELILTRLGATSEQLDRERDRVRLEFATS